MNTKISVFKAENISSKMKKYIRFKIAVFDFKTKRNVFKANPHAFQKTSFNAKELKTKNFKNKIPALKP